MSSIGDQLAAARRSKGLSLTDVERAIKVRMKYLEALENDDREMLPEDAYARGFLKVYAEFLGLDARQLLRQYRLERGTPEAVSIPEPIEELERDLPEVPRTVWIAAGLVVSLGLAIWIAAGLVSAARSPGGLELSSGGTAPTSTAHPKPARRIPEGKTEIVIRPAEEAFPYVEVSVDGRVAWEGLLSKRHRFVGRKVKVRASEAQEIEVVWEGKPVKIPQDETGLYEQTFIAR